MRIKHLLPLVVLAASLSFLSPPALAEDGTAALTSRLKEKYPATTFGNIETTPIPGLFQVQMGRNLVYADASGRYFVFGNIWDMDTQKDLSADKRTDINRVSWDALPLDHAIKIVKGNGQRALAVFTDPDCPYCKKLEQELQALTDATIYVFLYPIAQLHPDATERAEAVWCAKDRTAAWANLMLRGKEPLKKRCNAPLPAIQEAGKKLGVQGTPTLISKDGRMMAGAAPSDRISAWLDGAPR